MPTDLKLTVVEGSTLIVTAKFKDEDGQPVIPTSAVWTLMTRNAQVVNGRQDVVIAPLLAVVDIVLTGEDLAMNEPQGGGRILQVEALYNSTAGIGLHLNDVVTFKITDLIGIT